MRITSLLHRMTKPELGRMGRHSTALRPAGFCHAAFPRNAGQFRNSSGGQTMIFMIMALVILSFIVLWNFDLHKILNLKSRAQNAGDAAALGAARWQGITLNLIGDLNIMQAVMLSGGDTHSASQIADLQARLCFVGPGIGLLAAQQAAKINGIYANEDFTERLGDHANAVLTEYSDVFTEPYQGCWQDYGTILQTVAGQGVAAAPDNARMYSDYTGGHMLLNQNFYDAIAGRDWCWFKFNAMNLLNAYTDYGYWSPLPISIPTTHPYNSEIFGLGLIPRTTTLPGGLETLARMDSLRSNRNLSATVISNEVADRVNTWYVYDPGVWSSWSAISLEGEYPFPAVASVKPQYDHAGADAAIRIGAEADRLTPGSGNSIITWTAAAKPFGYLAGDEAPLRPNACTLVLPAFHNVRLIPVDASSAPAGGSYDVGWREHIENHLPLYMENGPGGLEAGCHYCRQLVLWEQNGFRDGGKNWLAATDDSGRLLHPCIVTGGSGGGGGGGGRRRGH